MKKRKGLIWLMGLLILGIAGCVSMVNLMGSEEKDVSYRIVVSSEDAKDITVYLPYPHYKGKPDKRIVEWLRENLEYRKKWENYSPETKIDLIDTKYGKMLYIYIPDCYIKLSTGEMGSSREIKIKENTVIKDYKLTYEDKIKIEDIERFPPSKERSDFYLKSILNLPIYTEFNGKGLIVSVGYSISTSYHGIPTTYFSYSFVNPQELPDTEKYYYSPINSSGWHWIPVLKTILDEEKLRKETEILGKRLEEMKKGGF